MGRRACGLQTRHPVRRAKASGRPRASNSWILRPRGFACVQHRRAFWTRARDERRSPFAQGVHGEQFLFPVRIPHLARGGPLYSPDWNHRRNPALHRHRTAPPPTVFPQIKQSSSFEGISLGKERTVPCFARCCSSMKSLNVWDHHWSSTNMNRRAGIHKRLSLLVHVHTPA